MLRARRSILATIAKQERVRLSERVHAGLKRARKEGLVVGRPRLLVSHKRILQLDEEGLTQREIAAEVGVSLGSVSRIISGHRMPSAVSADAVVMDG